MPEFIANFIKYLHHHTCGEFIKKLCSAAVRPIYENTTRYIVRLNLKATAAPDPDLDIKELTRADIDKMLGIMYVSHSGLQKRFSLGERCFAVLDNSRIMSYFWVQVNLKNLRELHLKFKLRSNQAWMYNAITVKAARGRGLYPNVIHYIAKTLINCGIDEAFIDVNPENFASNRGLEKASCTRIILINMKKIFLTTNYKAVIFDNNTWLKLSETLEGFDQRRLKYVTEHELCL